MYQERDAEVEILKNKLRPIVERRRYSCWVVSRALLSLGYYYDCLGARYGRSSDILTVLKATEKADK
ncbi:MAG: hypothetical protein IJS09_07585 [Treponema sp.]|nr:hypothetical protein [Treponema sp.]